MQYGVNSGTDDRETNVEKGENKAKKAWQEIYSFKAPGLTFEHLNKDGLRSFNLETSVTFPDLRQTGNKKMSKTRKAKKG